MKTSFCSIAFRSTDLTLEQIIGQVAEAGYDGIEIWGNHLTGKTAHNVEVRRMLERAGLEAPMISPYFDLTGTHSAWMRSVASSKIAAQAAVVLQSKLIRVFTGFKGSADVDERTWGTAVEGLKVMCSDAARWGITLALETHPRTLTDTVDSTVRLLNDVSAPNLGVNLDIYHFWDETGDFEAPLRALRKWVVHVHAKNTSLTTAERRANPHMLLHDKQAAQDFVGIAPLGEGQLPYRQFIASLLESGYNRYVSVEWFGDDPSGAVRTELAFLKRTEAELGGASKSAAMSSASVDEASDPGNRAPHAESARSATPEPGKEAARVRSGRPGTTAPGPTQPTAGDALHDATQKAAEAIGEAFANAAPPVKRPRTRSKKKTPPENQLTLDL